MNITSQEFRRDHVKIVLNWAPSDRLISYSANVIPRAPLNIETFIVELAIQYNTLYRFSIEAVLCSEENRTSTILDLYYGEKESISYTSMNIPVD